MARSKQATPIRRNPSSEYTSKAERPPAYSPHALSTLEQQQEKHSNGGWSSGTSLSSNGTTTQGKRNGAAGGGGGVTEQEVWKERGEDETKGGKKKEAGVVQLVVAVAGIYGSFLTWALLQERLTTTPYGSSTTTSSFIPSFLSPYLSSLSSSFPSLLSSSSSSQSSAPPEKFHYPIFLNTVQSLLAALTGFFYLYLTTPSTSKKIPSPIPSLSILYPLLLVALTTSLASPFGYASLAHIDYITFILAKSCKLLPVMLLHITLFGKRYPLYKYAVVLAVTAGVAVFTLHNASHKSKGHGSKSADEEKERHRVWGLLLLGVNLLLDGLTNTTQDHIFAKFKGYTGPQMMVANNVLSTVGTVLWLLVVGPAVAQSGLGAWLGLEGSASSSSSEAGEFVEALGFLGRHPEAWVDVLGFAGCGAVGQVFIFYTLSHFSSILLVTVTVTRKMFTMILSVVWFGHSLSPTQWTGVALVFGGVGAEAAIARREKLLKLKIKAEGEGTNGNGKGKGLEKEGKEERKWGVGNGKENGKEKEKEKRDNGLEETENEDLRLAGELRRVVESGEVQGRRRT